MASSPFLRNGYDSDLGYNQRDLRFFVSWHSLQIDEGWDLPSPNVTRFNMYFSESTLVAC